MFTHGLRGPVTATAIALASVFALSACAQGGAQASDGSGLSLRETKSIVQLLRNEVANRIPSEVVDSVGGTADVSITCGIEANDPKGYTRYWSSRIDVALTTGSSSLDVFDDLSASFKDQGWEVEDYTLGDAPRAQQLTGGSSVASLSLSLFDSTATAPALIRIEAHGPCVKTAGATSDEVKNLEAGSGDQSH